MLPHCRTWTHLSLVLVTWMPQRALAEEIRAATCEKQDVALAVAEAENLGGGVVLIPAGDCTWSGSDLRVSGDVSLIGAGSEQTVLHLAAERASHSFIVYNYNHEAETSFARISGIGFEAVGREEAGAGTASAIMLYWMDSYRIDHCRFAGQFHIAVGWKTTPGGLIDHCTFERTPGYEGSSYGLSPGSSYTPFETMPSVCDREVCTCQAGTAALERASQIATGNTVIAGIDDDGNSAAAEIDNTGGSGQGTVARLYLQIASVGANPNVDLAVFHHDGNNRFSTRSIAEAVPVSHGKVVLHSGRDFPVLQISHGDLLGVALHDCALAMDKSGTESWILAGDHVPATQQDFGSPQGGNVSLWAELFDAEGAFAQCEADWDAWWDDDTRGSTFDENWLPGRLDAHYVEDNLFDWRKSAMCANWGNVNKVVFRHNTFTHDTGAVFIGLKPGTVFGILHDNVFEQVGSRAGQALYPRTSGLIYHNTFRNLSAAGSFSSYRSYSDYYFTEQTRMRELYIFDNQYENCGCSQDGPNCWSVFDGEKPRSWIGEGYSYFFRAPEEGERLHGFEELTYPHPLIAASDEIVTGACIDEDGDGYGAWPSDLCPHAGIDCRDDDSSVHPAAVDGCNGLDDDCDGNTDPGCTQTPVEADPFTDNPSSGGSSTGEAKNQILRNGCAAVPPEVVGSMWLVFLSLVGRVALRARG